MKRGPLLLTIVAGIVVFLVVLVIYLPAGWFASMLPPQVRCTQLGGSIWNGECLGLSYQDASLGNASWNFATSSALRGRLSGNAEIHGVAMNGSADIDTTFSGVGELRNVEMRLILDHAPLPQLPRDLGGMVSVDLQKLEVSAGGAPRAILGTIQLGNLRQGGSQPLELGSYKVTFDGSPPSGGELLGKLSDIGGPFIVDGTLKLTPPNGYVVQGYITGRTADAERLVREITLGAMPDASGRSTFSFEGSY